MNDDNLLAHLFRGLLEMVGLGVEGTSQRVQATVLFGTITLFCLIAGLVTADWVSSVFLVIAAVCGLVTALAGLGVLD
jgi:hypothetical protein